MNTILDKRKIPDRRNLVQSVPHNLRALPDRRLNSIAVQWIPVEEISLYPELRTAFNHHVNSTH